jgi:FkbM family methyltransferase
MAWSPLMKAASGLKSLRPYSRLHYSQEGEDIVLARLFADQSAGFYVDIGAHHPRRFSNTYWAYQQGWRGINIDAAPGTKSRFDRVRKRDINLELCVTTNLGAVDFFVFPEPALNTVGAQRRERIEATTATTGQRVQVPSSPLSEVLDEYLPSGLGAIDFMSVDVEGSEMAVLTSNNWARYRPRVLVIEILGAVLDTIDEAEEIRFLRGQGYVPVSMLYHSVVLVADADLLATHWSIVKPSNDS